MSNLHIGETMTYANAGKLREAVMGSKGDKGATQRALDKLKSMGDEGKKLYAEAMKGVPQAGRNQAFEQYIRH